MKKKKSIEISGTYYVIFEFFNTFFVKKKFQFALQNQFKKIMVFYLINNKFSFHMKTANGFEQNNRLDIHLF